MELFARVLALVDQQLAWLELRAVVFGEAVHPIDDFVGTISVDVTERSAQKGRETQTKNGSDVAFKLRVVSELVVIMGINYHHLQDWPKFLPADRGQLR